MSGNCLIGYGGKEQTIANYQVLINVSSSWKYSNNGYGAALDAGWENGHALFLCRASYRGGVHPGKVVGDSCNISYGGREFPIRQFDLFYPRGVGPLSSGSGGSSPEISTLEVLGNILSSVGAQGSIGDSKSGSSSSSSSSTTRSRNTRTTTTTGRSSGSTISGGISIGIPGSMGDGINGVDWSDPGCETDDSAHGDNGGPRQAICANQPVPEDYVIVEAGSSKKCPNWTPEQKNTFTIKRPGDSETICSNSAMPGGYAVTAEGNSKKCPGWSATGQNTKTIARLR